MVTHRRILLVAWLAAVCACGFDSKKFDNRKCTADSDCRPDQTCVNGFCTQNACTTAADCNTDAQVACTNGLCVIQTCAALGDCELGFACSPDGLCVAGCPDHDGDGVGYGTACDGVQDCNDADPTVSPKLTEGPAGDPTCSDGKDNNCDGLIDSQEPACHQCADGLDNDGDGKIDFPDDPGCTDPFDDDEHGTAECDDGVERIGAAGIVGEVDLAVAVVVEAVGALVARRLL
ncbi:MAG: hypothetical protein ACM31C_03060, partial [Acidobacteriota bacterium]